MYSKPFLPEEFEGLSRPAVAKMPGVLLTSPVARGFETSVTPLQSPVLHLRCYHLVYHPPCFAYLAICRLVY
jgi:hypothetical protein